MGDLGAGADDLVLVAAHMNENFGLPVTGDKARLNSRKTIVTPPVEHFLSEYKSIEGVRSNYCYLVQPNCSYIHYRRYTCTSCVKCKELKFLECVNNTRGSWKKAKITKK